MKTETDKTSLEYKRSGITVRIRPTIKNGIERLILDYRVKGVRKLVWRSSPADGKATASDAVDKIISGQTEVLELTSADALVYLRARDTLARIDVPLDHAAAKYLEAVTLLAGRASILEACRAWLKRHNEAVPKKTVAEACDDCLAMTKADGKSGGAPETTQRDIRRLQARSKHHRFRNHPGHHSRMDVRSDVFSLGVMLFEMVTGAVPFRRATPVATMHAVAFDDTPTMSTLRPNLPAGLQRIVTKCLRKRPDERYPDVRSLIEELRVLRRETESGLAHPVSVKERIHETLERLRRLQPSEYAWLVGGILAVGCLVYLLFANVGLLFPLLPFAFVSLLIYRNIRNQPRKLLDLFVRKVAKIPEVRFIFCQGGKITVGVDQAGGQLYGRINSQLSHCNRKLFFGQPMSVVIRPDLGAEETRLLLAGAGVQYVRDDAVVGK